MDLKQCKVLTELLTQKLLKLDVMDVSGRAPRRLC